MLPHCSDARCDFVVLKIQLEFQLNKCLDNISLLLVSLHVRSLMFILLIPGEYLVKTGAT